MTNTLSVAALFTLINTAAFASSYCTLDDTAMFSCTFQNGAKAVEVCDAIWLDGDQAAYGFFKRDGTIEKEIITDKASLIYDTGTGLGAQLSESVSFNTNDGYTYEVYWSAARDADDVSGGINVLQNGDSIANLICDAGSVEHDLFTLIEMIDTAQISP